MKKIFTLCVGAMVAVSLVAAPIVRTASLQHKHVGQHVVEFTHKQALKAPAALNGSIISIVCTDMTEGNYEGYPYVYGTNDDYEVLAYLNPGESAENAFGQYSTAAGNIFLYVYDANAESEEGILLDQVTATYSLTGEEQTSFVATGVDEAGNSYNIAMTGKPISQYEYEEDSDYNHTFATYTVDESYLAKYGDVYVEAQDDQDNYIVLDITLAEGATSLAAGQYPVLSDYAAQSVLGGYFDASYNSMMPSYAAILTEYMGQMYIGKVWYITSGTVTVNADGSITVAAKNSLGHDVNATLVTRTADAVENVTSDVKAVKTIQNGQIVIEKNGVKYNMLGTEMK